MDRCLRGEGVCSIVGSAPLTRGFASTSPNGRGKMSSTETPIDMLAPIEDRGGAAQPLLQVNGLTKHFPVRGDLFSARKTVRAVDNVSFAIAKGETVGIVGESGCGKSTTARLLMHLMTRDSGDIIYDGMQVGRALSLRELRRAMQMVFQDSYA